MDRMNLFNSFEFKRKAIFNKNVQSKSAIQNNFLILQRQRLLPFMLDTDSCQLHT